MTIDERLEKLAERHESLTYTVELLAVESGEMQKRHDALLKRHDELRVFVNDIAHAAARLVSKAQDHEHRIGRLEEQQSD